jgi:4-hydroxy-2-oxoheptanedioate aldolase
MTSTAADRKQLANRLASGEGMVGLIMKMPSPASTELAGHLGFDFVIIDTEHGIAGGAELDHHIRAADSAGVPVVVRVGTLDRPEIARALDAGATGIVIPQVDTAEAAREAVRLAHYPPFGARGLATSTRAGGQGTVPGRQHLAAARENTAVIVQIESRKGVENVQDILAVEGVSAAWIGLSDLSLELGHFGDLNHPEMINAVDQVVAAAAVAGVPLLVIADNEADGALWLGKGAQVLLINLLTVVARGLSDLKTSHHLAQNERTHA